MDTLDFLSAWSKHLEWKAKLANFLGGCEKWSLTEAQAISHHDCELGKWLDSCGLAKYAPFPAIREFEKTHEKLHSTVKRMLEIKRLGDTTRANQECRKLQPISEKLAAILEKLEKQVAAAGRTELAGRNAERVRC